MYAHEEAAPDHAAGMKFREILLVKSARLQQYHGQRVAQGEHDCRARGRRQIERTSFLLDVDIEKEMRGSGEGRFRITADGDDLHLEASDGRQTAEQVLRFSTCAPAR